MTFSCVTNFYFSYDVEPSSIVYTTIAIFYDQKIVGYITISDSIKEDSKETVEFII